MAECNDDLSQLCYCLTDYLRRIRMRLSYWTLSMAPYTHDSPRMSMQHVFYEVRQNAVQIVTCFLWPHPRRMCDRLTSCLVTTFLLELAFP